MNDKEISNNMSILIDLIFKAYPHTLKVKPILNAIIRLYNKNKGLVNINLFTISQLVSF